MCENALVCLDFNASCRKCENERESAPRASMGSETVEMKGRLFGRIDFQGAWYLLILAIVSVESRVVRTEFAGSHRGTIFIVFVRS